MSPTPKPPCGPLALPIVGRDLWGRLTGCPVCAGHLDPDDQHPAPSQAGGTLPT